MGSYTIFTLMTVSFLASLLSITLGYILMAVALLSLSLVFSLYFLATFGRRFLKYVDELRTRSSDHPARVPSIYIVDRDSMIFDRDEWHHFERETRQPSWGSEGSLEHESRVIELLNRRRRYRDDQSQATGSDS